MFRLLAPVVFHPTPEARSLLTGRLRPASIAAWQAIARARQGLEFAFLPFRFEDVPLALSSRLNAKGLVIIELALDDGLHPERIITAAAHRWALARAQR